MKKFTNLTTPKTSRFLTAFGMTKGNLPPFLTLLRSCVLTVFLLTAFTAYGQNQLVINLNNGNLLAFRIFHKNKHKKI